MIQKLILSIVAIFIATSIFSQNCETCIPNKIGTELTYKTTNKKGKTESFYSDKLLSVKKEDGATKYAVLRKNFDKKKELITANTIYYYCKGNSFYIDTSSYISSEEMAKYDESIVELDTENIGYPAGMKPGMTLEDGYINADIAAGFIPIVFRTDVINRKVVSSEKITTDAGTFQTLKITENLKLKIAFAKANLSSITWVKKEVGTIRGETYDKAGKLMSRVELISIK